jgi:heme/copper-type cytochrome/quinol oxidase subunit 3
MLIIIITGAILTFVLLVSALVIAMAIRKSKTGKRKLYITHRIIAILGICFAAIHALLAYNFFIHKLF